MNWIVVSGLRGYWLCLAHLTSTIRNIHLIHLSSVVAEGVEDRSRSHRMPQLQYAVNVPSYKASPSACRTQVKSYSHAYNRYIGSPATGFPVSMESRQASEAAYVPDSMDAAGLPFVMFRCTIQAATVSLSPCRICLVDMSNPGLLVHVPRPPLFPTYIHSLTPYIRITNTTGRRHAMSPLLPPSPRHAAFAAATAVPHYFCANIRPESRPSGRSFAHRTWYQRLLSYTAASRPLVTGVNESGTPVDYAIFDGQSFCGRLHQLCCNFVF